MAIGNPINLTSNVEGKSISVSATAGQTQFTVTGGYRINQISVYRNGVRLVDGRDFTATDGSIVTLLSAASVDDVVEFQVFDDFRVSDALNVNSGGTVNGDVTVTGSLNVSSSLTGTATTAQGLTGSPDIAVTNITAGIITATTFSGNGSALTGVASTDNIITGTAATFTSDVNIADSIIHVGDTNTKIRFPAADTFTVETAGSERLRILANGLIGIGTDNPDAFNPNADDLVIFGTGHQGLTIRSGTSHDGSIMFNDTNDANQRGIIRYIHTDDAMAFHTSGGEALRVDSSGRVLIGTSSVLTGTDSQYSFVQNIGNSFGSTTPGYLSLGRSEVVTSMSNNDPVGRIFFTDNAAATFAYIEAAVDAAPGNSDFPGRLVFFTCADGASSPTERLRIASAGQIGLGGANYGSSGQVITSNGSGSAPTWQDTGTPTIASQAEAEAGTNNTNMMTPLRVKQAIDELGGDVIQSIQRGTISINDTDSSGTATITSVTTTKAMLNHLGQSGQGNNARDGFIRITLTNATTVTANRQSANGSVSVNYQVVEFK